MDDLGIKRTQQQKKEEFFPSGGGHAQVGGGDSVQAAAKAIVVGSLLLSSAKAMKQEGDESDDMTPIFATGAVLMALGAVYAGQLIYEASQCCLKRLRVAGDVGVPPDLVRQERQRDVVVVSEDESTMRSSSEERQDDGSRRTLSKGTGAGSSQAVASSLDITSRSGSAGIADPMGSIATSSCKPTSSSGSMGASDERLAVRARSSSAGSLNIKPRPGMHGELSASSSATKSMSAQSGSAGAGTISRCMSAQSGFGSTGAAAGSFSAAATMGTTDESRVGNQGDQSKQTDIKNPWIFFSISTSKFGSYFQAACKDV